MADKKAMTNGLKGALKLVENGEMDEVFVIGIGKDGIYQGFYGSLESFLSAGNIAYYAQKAKIEQS